MIKGILNLEFHTCATLGCESNLVDLQLLTVLLTNFD